MSLTQARLRLGQRLYDLTRSVYPAKQSSSTLQPDEDKDESEVGQHDGKFSRLIAFLQITFTAVISSPDHRAKYGLNYRSRWPCPVVGRLPPFSAMTANLGEMTGCLGWTWPATGQPARNEMR